MKVYFVLFKVKDSVGCREKLSHLVTSPAGLMTKSHDSMLAVRFMVQGTPPPQCRYLESIPSLPFSWEWLLCHIFSHLIFNSFFFSYICLSFTEQSLQFKRKHFSFFFFFLARMTAISKFLVKLSAPFFVPQLFLLHKNI